MHQKTGLHKGGSLSLAREDVDQLVDAMAAYAVPEGIGAEVPIGVTQALAPVMADIWL